MNTNKQGDLFLSIAEAPAEPYSVAATQDAENRWLGLTTNNRRLFDALQDGWLHPLDQDVGLLTGVGAYASENIDRGGNLISVRLKLDIQKLPDLDVLSLRGKQWVSCELDEVDPSDDALYWLGVMPTSAISEFEVTTEEERTRLTSMSRQFSNMELPDVPIRVAPDSQEVEDCIVPPTEPKAKFVIPYEVDAIRGAMSMAIWAVPRIDPWMDVLVASLSNDWVKLVNETAQVEADWLRFSPWSISPGRTSTKGTQDGLWQAAIDTFKETESAVDARPRELAEKIASTAESRYECSQDEVAMWLSTTKDILRAETTIQLDNWRSCSVGIAIQLVLARPEPTKFRTWCKDLPNLPPGVWWSAAILCGLNCGYKRLDLRFRGPAFQREALAAHALCLSIAEGQQISWLSLSGVPRWRREADGFTFLWGDREVDRKPDQARGQWYSANFEDEKVRDQAVKVAENLGWSCLQKELKLSKGNFPLSGSGKVAVRNRKLDITGDVEIRLPQDVVIENVLDVEAFRHQLLVATGQLPEPPKIQAQDIPHDSKGIPGLVYVSDFLSEEEERKILTRISESDWSRELKRRVQHYGWRYDYKARSVNSSMHIGPLPDWAQDIAQRLVSNGYVPQLPDQVIVNEYVGNQGISRHVDSESSFEDGIAMISLCESWEMVFRELHGNRKEICRLEQRSAAIMSGDARYQWSHEIPARKNEPGTSKETKPGRVERGKRISLTFRRVIQD